TALVGFVTDDVITRGFGSLDSENFYEWMDRHGTVAEGTRVTAASCWMQAAYDSSFAYQNGDSTSPPIGGKPLLGSPGMGAGTVLRGALRLGCAFKGAMAWKFQTGCGEALVAPIYEVLRRRGVKFEFFSKVEHLGLASDARLVIDTIRIQRQVALVNTA